MMDELLVKLVDANERELKANMAQFKSGLSAMAQDARMFPMAVSLATWMLNTYGDELDKGDIEFFANYAVQHYHNPPQIMADSFLESNIEAIKGNKSYTN